MNHIDIIWPGLIQRALISPIIKCKQGDIREIIGCHFTLDGAQEQFCLNTRRKLSPIYANAELLWYLSWQQNADLIREYAPQYSNFCEDDGTAYGAYGHRLHNNVLETTGDDDWDWNLLDICESFLKRHASTKQCVALMWKPIDLVYAHDRVKTDIPCTISWQFLIRDRKLIMICSMRSCDLWKGGLYDPYVNTIIQRWMAARLGIIAGEYHHIVGSMHLYERNVKAAREALSVPTYCQYTFPKDTNFTDNDRMRALKIEEELRRARQFLYTDTLQLPYVLHDAVQCCYAHYDADRMPNLISPTLQIAMEQFLAKPSKQDVSH